MWGEKLKLYASMVVNGSDGWGDSFPALWFCEYLASKNPSLEIDLYGGGSAESALTLSSKLKYEVLKRIYPALYSDFYSSDDITKGVSIKSESFTSKLNKLVNLVSKKPFHHASFIEKPIFISKWLYSPPSPRLYDEVLVTHHNHNGTGLSWASPPIIDKMYGGLLPPFAVWSKDAKLPEVRRMDLNADLLNMMFRDNFRPTMPELKTDIKKELELLPDSYICIQPRSSDSGPLHHSFPTRNNLSGEKYNDWINKFAHDCWKKWSLPIVITSGNIESDDAKIIDATKFSLWAKIETHRRSRYSYVAHSGFGMIVAIYRGLEDVKLINPLEAGIHRNPPVLLFSNVTEIDEEIQYSSSPPGWIDQSFNWKIDYDDTLQP